MPSCSICYQMLLVVLVQVLLVSQLLPLSHSSLVKFLPGLQGPLPFELETGYVGVGESEELQLFYYFVKSERNPEKDPLMLWLTGGPGCSAVSALFFEIGPLNFKVEQYNGSLPTLVLNPHSWTKVCSIIFIDSPVGTGFSYARTSFASQPGDLEQVQHALQFLRRWLVDHPSFMSNPFYIGGDSYSGIPVPVLAEQISNGNEAGVKPIINLQGYILGNPVTVRQYEVNSEIPFAHGMGLISDELYESLTTSCRGDFQDVDPSNVECVKNVQAFDECTSHINFAHILERHCDGLISPKLQHMLGKRRYLSDNNGLHHHSRSPLPTFGCRTYGYLLSQYWANDPVVRKVLHIRKGSIGNWQRCDYDMPYVADLLGNSLQYHVNLSAKGYPSLIYSGDHDMLVPFLGTQAWIRSLNYSIVDDWRPWFVHSQIAGYTRTYANRMTFATVKGAGHTAPEYKREECLNMFTRWISGELL
ncbi:PREDICTED: serine carboxypeptidase-like 18-like [Fragaria vesca subsp. vesca]